MDNLNIEIIHYTIDTATHRLPVTVPVTIVTMVTMQSDRINETQRTFRESLTFRNVRECLAFCSERKELNRPTTAVENNVPITAAMADLTTTDIDLILEDSLFISHRTLYVVRLFSYGSGRQLFLPTKSGDIIIITYDKLRVNFIKREMISPRRRVKRTNSCLQRRFSTALSFSSPTSCQTLLQIYKTVPSVLPMSSTTTSPEKLHLIY